LAGLSGRPLDLLPVVGPSVDRSTDLGPAMRLVPRSTPPRLPGAVVTVQAVRTQLDRWAAVTVVPGIQGYGKTTAVAAWLHDQPPSVRTFWVTARGAQRDELDAGEAVAARELLAALAAATEAPGQLVVVIDDAHFLRDERLLRELVDAVAHHPRLHLIVCARGPHPIELIAAARVETVFVAARHLLFTVDEIGQLATAMGLELTEAEAHELARRFGGWPAAVRLVLEALGPSHRPGDDLPLSRAGDYLRDVVIPEIRDQATLGEIIRFSLADRLTHKLIGDLCDRDDPDAVVRQIEAPGLAERRYESDDVVLVLPSFIRDSLRDSYAHGHPAQARQMHQRLAAWYARHDGPGHVMSALHHAVAGDDPETIDRIWTRHSTELTLRHTERLVAALSRLPESHLAARPGMRVALEVCRVLKTDAGASEHHAVTGDRRMLGLRAYVEASRRVAASGLDELRLHDLLMVGTGVIIGLRLAGKLVEATEYGDAIDARAMALLADGDDPGDQAAWFQLQRGVTRTVRGHHRAASHHYQLTWQSRRVAAPMVAALAASGLALTHAVPGESPRAHLWLERYRALDTDVLPNPTFAAAAAAALARGVLALDRLDGAGSAAAIAELDCGSAVELWAYVECFRAQHGLHFGDPAASLAVLDSTVGSHPRAMAEKAADSVLLARARADLLLAEGQGQHAHGILADHNPEKNPILAVPLVRLNLLAGDPIEASRIAANLLWLETIDHRSRQELLLLRAVAAHRTGDLTTSIEMSRRALALYQHTRLLRPFGTIDRADLDDLLGTAGLSLDAEDLARIDAHPNPFSRTVTLIRLTPREQLLVAALATIDSRQQIADRMYVSLNTVRTQLATLYRKLGVNTREEALVRLAGLGLLGDQSSAKGA
jgi:LuxR family maltose regulon positive regulatory protein